MNDAHGTINAAHDVDMAIVRNRDNCALSIQPRFSGRFAVFVELIASSQKASAQDEE